jgi:hypothetical protein
LALHAIIQRCVSNTPVNRNVQPVVPDGNGRATSEASSNKSNGGAIAPGVVRKWMGIDGPFIAEVIDGCRNVLEIVKLLAAKGHLKHCPVRTYFRIIAGACFLLKVRIIFLLCVSFLLT